MATIARIIVLIVLLLFPLKVLAAPEVLVSLLPLHSLTARVMQGVAEPELLLPGGASPHSFALKPSQARQVQQADLIVWVGPELETFLTRSLSNVAGNAQLLTLADQPQLDWLPARAAGLLAETDHDEDGHGHVGAIDYHFWLSPRRAAVLAGLVAETLAALDPANVATYRANAAGLQNELKGLSAALQQQLQPYRTLPYVVFHDAYQYFEKDFGLEPLGSVAIHPERPPGARRIRELREAIRRTGARCVFSEPQFEPRLVRALVEGSRARAAVLDPLGSQLAPGPEAYPALLQALADAFAACAAGEEK